jgi:hypothetical protein
MAVPMIVSGYLIQTAVTPAWRTAWIAIHLAASGLWVAGYLTHALAKKKGDRTVAGEGTAVSRERSP